MFLYPEYASIILNSWKFLRKNERLKLYAFVIMPNHIHFIMKPCKNWAASQICFDFEKYTAHEILNKLRDDEKADLIEYFENKAKNMKGRKHNIWQDIQAKNIYSEKFLVQKMEHVHGNPVRKGWELAKNRADYKYSSACFYDKGRKPVIEIDDLSEVLN